MSGSTDDHRQLKLPYGSLYQEVGGKPQGPEAGPRSSAALSPDEPHASEEDLLEQVLSRDNLFRALSRVEANRGAPGIDGMTTKELPDYLKEHWPAIREALYAGCYQPTPVRRVEIPKPGGSGVRLLGIPTVLDRLIQQSLAQVLGRLFDPHFSDACYGFRPGRSAHQAVRAAQGFIRSGHRWVVDLDLARFFDRVSHGKLMARVARRVKDKRVLMLIRKYLESGVMLNGVVVRTEEGTPQGGPLSQLLAIILQTRLSLVVNEAKSAVDRPWRRKFLGFSFVNRKAAPAIRVANQALKRAKEQLRRQYLRGAG